jgi:hypothetical protein
MREARWRLPTLSRGHGRFAWRSTALDPLATFQAADHEDRFSSGKRASGRGLRLCRQVSMFAIASCSAAGETRNIPV